MAFNNYGNNNAPTDQGEKKRTNFPIGKLWGIDGVVDVSVWCADTGVKTIISGKISVGKDPSTGANVFEQKKPNELPRFFMNINHVKALLDSCENADPTQLNVTIDKGQAGKLTITGSPTEIKFVIDSCKQGIGSRTITFPSMNINGKPVHSDFNVFLDYMKICYKKALYNKLDADEFGLAVSEDDNLPI